MNTASFCWLGTNGPLSINEKVGAPHYLPQCMRPFIARHSFGHASTGKAKKMPQKKYFSTFNISTFTLSLAQIPSPVDMTNC